MHNFIYICIFATTRPPSFGVMYGFVNFKPLVVLIIKIGLVRLLSLCNSVLFNFNFCDDHNGVIFLNLFILNIIIFFFFFLKIVYHDTIFRFIKSFKIVSMCLV